MAGASSQQTAAQTAIREPQRLEQQPPLKGFSSQSLDLKALNASYIDAGAQALVQWGLETFGDSMVMSTSFGIQSAVMLHLVTSVAPETPIIWVDTGYLPDATYHFADQLTERLNLNLKVYQSPLSPAHMEARYGRLWEKGTVEALNQYDQIRKVEPMQRALKELGAKAWLAGLRAKQTEHRNQLQPIGTQNGIYKLLPILSWHSRDIYNYLTEHDLPYHPYFDDGYVTVGDWHSSRPLSADDDNERDTRFQGLKQECGLHLPQTPEEAESLDSSSL